MYDRGERPSLTYDPIGPDGVIPDIHSVASLLKSYLRDLPQPLIPFAGYEKVMHLVSREREEIGEEQAVLKLSQMMTYEMLSPSTYNTMQYLCRFLADVASNSDANKMNALNLATVFVQSFIRPEVDDPNLMLATSAPRTVATQVSIRTVDLCCHQADFLLGRDLYFD
jgi:Rho GTPase-activating protein 22/24/25